jgi:hypothetical protein
MVHPFKATATELYPHIYANEKRFGNGTLGAP